MECNQYIIGIGKSNNFARSSEDQQVSSHIRLYRCSFCKRGFSNAQALGGHMNVHRRDRAKLKQALACEDHSFLSLTITTDKSPLHASSAADEESSSSSCNPKVGPSPTPEIEEDGNSIRGKGKMKPLLLFEETSLSSETKHLCSNLATDSGLDLELRLGL